MRSFDLYGSFAFRVDDAGSWQPHEILDKMGKIRYNPVEGDGVMARLSEIFDLQMGKTPARANSDYWYGGTHNWVSIADLSGYEKYVESTKEQITDKAVQESGIKAVPPNTVIMSFKLSLGKTAITREVVYTNEAIIAFIPNEQYKIFPDYFFYMFSGKDWSKGTNRAVMGATLNKATIGEISVDIPPLDRQIYVSTVLNKLSHLISLRKQQLAKLDELVKVRFVEMFGDLKHNSMGWPVYSFNDFARIDTTMIHDFEEYGDYPHIGIDSIEKDSGNLNGYRTVKEDGVISGKYLFTPEHIIYSKIRPNLNKVALPNFTGVCSADAYPILPKEGVCNREFLACTLRSPVFLDYILVFSHRTNLPKVNKQQVEGFWCPIPNIRLQEQFASFLSKIAQRKPAIQQSLDKLELLKKSLMQKYFM